MLHSPYEVIILVDAGIGNAIQALYAVEYCLHNKVNVGIYLSNVNKSFQEYLRNCYGSEVVLSSLENASAKHLIHSFTYQKKIDLKFDFYFYVNPDSHSSKNLSETEQYLSVVKALFPSSYQSDVLTFLKEDYSDNVKALSVNEKYVLYPGGSAVHSSRRWPHYLELIKMIGNNDVVIVGGKDDVNYEFSFVYPKLIAALLPQSVLNKRILWKFFKKLHTLKPHAHFDFSPIKSNVFIEKFSWPELVALFKRCKKFIGNDGGLTHLAAASGAYGVVLFGPTSVLKNQPVNPSIKSISKSYSCQPCQFGPEKVKLTNYFINCPYGVKCMNEISPESIFDSICD